MRPYKARVENRVAQVRSVTGGFRWTCPSSTTSTIRATKSLADQDPTDEVSCRESSGREQETATGNSRKRQEGYILPQLGSHPSTTAHWASHLHLFVNFFIFLCLRCLRATTRSLSRLASRRLPRQSRRYEPLVSVECPCVVTVVQRSISTQSLLRPGLKMGLFTMSARLLHRDFESQMSSYVRPHAAV